MSARDGPSPAPRATLDVEAVHLVGPDGGQRRTVEADLVAVAGGWNPALQLYRAIGGGLRYDEDLATFVPDG